MAAGTWGPARTRSPTSSKLGKDLTNGVNYIMMKVNGRISDAVNGVRI